LACLKEIKNNLNWEKFNILSIGTDGVDGVCPKKVAGAFATEKTLQTSIKNDLSIDKYLNNNDSYHFFLKTKNLIITNPTRTNLGDLILINWLK
jgi:hydroxypyruvate reductase